MNVALIYEYCEVIADRQLADGHRAIFYRENGSGIVETDILDEGEQVCFSCDSLEEFEDILDVL